MSQTGWVPVDESAAKGWTPVTEKPAAAAQRQPGLLEQALGPAGRGVGLGLESAFGLTPPTPGDPESLGAGDALKQLGGGFMQSLADVYRDLRGQASPYSPQGIAASALTPPGMLARGIEGLASTATQGGRDIYGGLTGGGGEQAGRGMGELLGAGGQILGGAGAAKELSEVPGKTALEKFAPPEYADATRAIKRSMAVRNGKADMAEQYVRRPLQILDNAVEGEVGRHAQVVLDADKADMAAKGIQTGLVDMTGVSTAVNDAVGKVFDEQYLATPSTHRLLVEAGTGKMSLTSAKALTSEIGKLAARMEHTGKAAQAVPLWVAYKTLHEATLARATELGMDKSWNKYISEYRAYHGTKANPGPAGLVHELLTGDPEAALDKFNTANMTSVLQAAQRYSVDTSTLTKAMDQAPKLSSYIKEDRNIIIGKLRAMYKRPLAVGGPAVGAGVVAGAAGLPMGHFIVPLLTAAYVSRAIDTADVVKILRELKPRMPETGLGGPSAPGTPRTSEPAPRAPSPRGPERRVGQQPISQESRSGGERRTVPLTAEGPSPARGALASEIKKILDDPKASARDKKIAREQLADVQENPFESAGEEYEGFRHLAQRLQGARKARGAR